MKTVVIGYSLHYEDLFGYRFGLPLKAKTKKDAEKEADEHLCGLLIQPDSRKIAVDVAFV